MLWVQLFVCDTVGSWYSTMSSESDLLYSDDHQWPLARRSDIPEFTMIDWFDIYHISLTVIPLLALKVSDWIYV